MRIGLEGGGLHLGHRTALQPEAVRAAVAQAIPIGRLGRHEIPLGRNVERHQPRHPRTEERRDERGTDLSVGDGGTRIVRVHDVAEIVDQPGDLEFGVGGPASGEDVCALEGVVEDVDRVTVGTERVEYAGRRGDELDQCFDGARWCTG